MNKGRYLPAVAFCLLWIVAGCCISCPPAGEQPRPYVKSAATHYDTPDAWLVNAVAEVAAKPTTPYEAEKAVGVPAFSSSFGPQRKQVPYTDMVPDTEYNDKIPAPEQVREVIYWLRPVDSPPEHRKVIGIAWTADGAQQLIWGVIPEP